MSIICQALEGLQLTEDFCANFAKTLKFSYGQHLTFALALSQSSTSSVQQQGRFPLLVLFSHGLPQGSPPKGDVQAGFATKGNLTRYVGGGVVAGIRVLKSKLPECSTSNLQTLPDCVFSKLIQFLQTNPSFDAQERSLALKSAQALHPRESCDLALFPLLYAEGCDGGSFDKFRAPEMPVMAVEALDSGESTMLAEALEDMGYRACSSVEVMAEILGTAGEVNESSVAHVLAMMARTLSGMPTEPDVTHKRALYRPGKSLGNTHAVQGCRTGPCCRQFRWRCRRGKRARRA